MLQRARIVLAAACIAAILPLSACARDGWDAPRTAPAPIGAPAAGFLPEAPPAPESMVEPAHGSWAGVHPAPGYRVVLLTIGDDAPTRALVDAVQQWAASERVELRTVRATAHDPVAGIVDAMEMNADLIVSAGDGLVDPLAIVSANHLDRQFLIVGAELAEPTGNVTAVDWTGASFRGEGLGQASNYDPASFTPERCGDAIRAGAAAVLTGLTGVVIRIR